MIWVIEDGPFKETDYKFEEFADVVKIKYRPFDNTNPYEVISGEFPHKHRHDVMFYGSINMGRRLIKKGFFWQVWLYDKVFDVNHWMGYFGNSCLNSDGALVPFGILKRHLSDMYNKCAFIRPNTGYKLFSGHIIDFWDLKKSDYDWKELNNLQEQFHIFPEDLIFVAPPAKIPYEYRFVISSDIECKNTIVTASQYKENGELLISKNVPVETYDYVNSIIQRVKYHPAPLWTLDVGRGEDPKQNYIIETGSFTSAGLYDCDIEKIVKEAERLMKEYL